MTKKVLLVLLLIILVSCSNDEEKKEGIKSVDTLENKIEKVKSIEQEQEQEHFELNKKDEFQNKIIEVENSLEEFDEIYESGITIELKYAEHETYARWDALLNEIWTVLKEQLSLDEMTELTEMQKDWIIKRDETAANEASEFAGGTFEQVQFLNTQGRLTKERCIELVENYMK